MADDLYQRALSFFNARNYQKSRDVLVEALAAQPDNADMLKLMGKNCLELGREDASEYLHRAVVLQPGDANAWQDLSDALVNEGRTSEATAALREAIKLQPRDVSALTDLAHTLLALGEIDEALVRLSQAAEIEPGNLSILRSLIDMYRQAGRLDEALHVATRILELQPDDVLATMDMADLNLALGNLDPAVRCYSRLRQIDTDQGLEDHEVYAYHGMIQAEMARERWRRVLDLAVDATRVDRYGLTTDVLAFAVAQVFGAGDRPAPSRPEVDAALAIEQAEHRRLHTEALTYA